MQNRDAAAVKLLVAFAAIVIFAGGILNSFTIYWYTVSHWGKRSLAMQLRLVRCDALGFQATFNL